MKTFLKLILKIVLALFVLGITIGIGMSAVIPLIIGGQDLPSFYLLRIIGGTVLDVLMIWIIVKL